MLLPKSYCLARQASSEGQVLVNAGDGAPHHRPHFHAYYQDAAAVLAIDPVECIGGSLPRTQLRLVEAWAEIHREELQRNWGLLQSGQPPVKIEPLR